MLNVRNAHLLQTLIWYWKGLNIVFWKAQAANLFSFMLWIQAWILVQHFNCWQCWPVTAGSCFPRTHIPLTSSFSIDTINLHLSVPALPTLLPPSWPTNANQLLPSIPSLWLGAMLRQWSSRNQVRVWQMVVRIRPAWQQTHTHTAKQQCTLTPSPRPPAIIFYLLVIFIYFIYLFFHISTKTLNLTWSHRMHTCKHTHTHTHTNSNTHIG